MDATLFIFYFCVGLLHEIWVNCTQLGCCNVTKWKSGSFYPALRQWGRRSWWGIDETNSGHAFLSNLEWLFFFFTALKSPPFPLSDQVRHMRWICFPVNHLICAKSAENPTVWYLPLWLVHSLNYMSRHWRLRTHWRGKEEVAHQVITENTHGAVGLLPDLQEISARLGSLGTA